MVSLSVAWAYAGGLASRDYRLSSHQREAIRPHRDMVGDAEESATGTYEFRVRSVDLNGEAQPEPRRDPKSSRNEIQSKTILVMG